MIVTASEQLLIILSIGPTYKTNYNIIDIRVNDDMRQNNRGRFYYPPSRRPDVNDINVLLSNITFLRHLLFCVLLHTPTADIYHWDFRANVWQMILDFHCFQGLSRFRKSQASRFRNAAELPKS